MIDTSDGFLDQHGECLTQRVRAGLIRDAHGDLHAGNIFLYPDPVIFDCIEFNDEMRHVDILDEVAFLAMDIESFGEPELSASFYRLYSDCMALSDDGETLLLYRYYKLYRAGIRAKVHLMKAVEDQAGESQQQSIANALRYLRLVKDYMHHFEQHHKYR